MGAGTFVGEVKDIYQRTKTLMLYLVLVTAGCACIYYVGSQDGWGIVAAFEEKTDTGAAAGISFLDCLYFSAITVTTLGYGDYLPLSYGRLVAGLESLSGVILIGVFVSRLVSKHQDHLTRRLMHRAVDAERGGLRGRMMRLLGGFKETPLLLVKDKPSKPLARAAILIGVMARHWRFEVQDPEFVRVVSVEYVHGVMGELIGLLGCVKAGLGEKQRDDLHAEDAKNVQVVAEGAVAVGKVLAEKMKMEDVEDAYERIEGLAEGLKRSQNI